MFPKLKIFCVCLLAIFVLTGVADTADAKRLKFRSKSKKSRSVPVIIPLRVGGSTNVVFVHELPDVKAFSFKDKGYFDLGYKHSFWGGDWVGYFDGPNKSYVMLNQKVAKELVAALGLTKADIPPYAGAVRENGSYSGSASSATGMFYSIAGIAFLVLIVGGAGFIIAVVRQGRADRRSLDNIDFQEYATAAPSTGQGQSQQPAFGGQAPRASFGRRPNS